MSYSLISSVADWRALLDVISTFAVADGWTEEYDVNPGGINKQIAFSKSNCHISIGEKSGENPITVTGSVDDARLYAALATSITPANEQFWGHPGSIVTTETDVDRIRINDLNGPMANVWLFSGGASDVDYVHVIMQTAGDRYHHFSFGIGDDLGMSTPDVGYSWGLYHQWWDTAFVSNNVLAVQHEMSFLAREPGCHINIPTGVLPAGYPSAGVYKGSDYLTSIMTIADEDADHYAAVSGNQLDFFLPTANQLTTGGTALYSLPIMFREDTGGTSHVWIGNFPGVKLVNIANHTPGSTLLIGSDEWLVFPWKRKGLRENAANGGTPLLAANTIEYGLAYKKNV